MPQPLCRIVTFCFLAGAPALLSAQSDLPLLRDPLSLREAVQLAFDLDPALEGFSFLEEAAGGCPKAC
jgi:hypothetical protein